MSVRLWEKSHRHIHTHTDILCGQFSVTAFRRSRQGFSCLSLDYNYTSYRVLLHSSKGGWMLFYYLCHIQLQVWQMMWPILPTHWQMWWQERTVSLSALVQKYESPAATANNESRLSSLPAPHLYRALKANRIYSGITIGLQQESQIKNKHWNTIRREEEKEAFSRESPTIPQWALAPTHVHMHTEERGYSLGGWWTLIKQGGSYTSRCGLHLVGEKVPTLVVCWHPGTAALSPSGAATSLPT